MFAYPLRLAMAILVLLLVMVVVYWIGLHGGFFFDDEANILLAEGVRLQSLTFQSIYQALISGGSGPSGRPIAQFSFALNYYLSGFDPFVFKATNLAIHIACAVPVFLLVYRLLDVAGAPVNRRNIFLVSSAVAAVWLLHPIQLLPVLHVVQRMTSLSAFFLLAALLFHIYGRERNGRAGMAFLFLAWGILWPLSFLSKETGALFPFFVVAWELIVRRSSSGKLDPFAKGFLALAGLIFLVGVIYLLSPSAQWLWSGYDSRPFSLAERLLTEGRVLWFYLGLIVAPRLDAFGLYHDDIAVSLDAFTPWTTLPALFGLASLFWFAWRLRIRAPLISFGIVWFLIGHTMESTVLPLEIAHEHRNYLPLFGILLVGGRTLLCALESVTYRFIGISISVAVLAYFTFITALRAHQFGEEGRRTQIEAQHHRTSARAQYQAGLTLAGFADAALPDSPVHAFARSHYEQASELDPNFKLGWLGLIHLNCKAGMDVGRAEIDELSRRLQETPFAPGDKNVLYSLKEMSIAGSLCLTRGEIDELFAAALANRLVSPWVRSTLHSWHADYLWLRERDLLAARVALGQSLALVPTNVSNRLKWAQLQYLSGEYEPARNLLLELRGERFSMEERAMLDDLLSQIGMLHSQTLPKQLEP